MTTDLNTIKDVFESFEGAAVNLSARIAAKEPYDPVVVQRQKDTGTAFLLMLADTLPAVISKAIGLDTLPWALKMGALQSNHTAVASRCDDMLEKYFGYRATAIGKRVLSEDEDNVRKSLCSIWKQASAPLQPPKTRQQKFVDFCTWSENILKSDATVTDEMKAAITKLVDRFNQAIESHAPATEAVEADIPGFVQDEALQEL